MESPDYLIISPACGVSTLTQIDIRKGREIISLELRLNKVIAHSSYHMIIVDDHSNSVFTKDSL